jgi:hypothetical protein
VWSVRRAGATSENSVNAKFNFAEFLFPDVG